MHISSSIFGTDASIDRRGEFEESSFICTLFSSIKFVTMSIELSTNFSVASLTFVLIDFLSISFVVIPLVSSILFFIELYDIPFVSSKERNFSSSIFVSIESY